MKFSIALSCVVTTTLLPMFAQQALTIPAITVSSPNYQLSTTAEDACSADYANMEVIGENRGWKARLRNGKFEQVSTFGYQGAKLKQVYCIGEGKEKFAILFVDWSDCGGSCTNVGVVQLVNVRNKRPIVIQQFTFDTHADGTGATFNKNSRVLTLIGRSDDGSPNCCAKNLDVVEFSLQGRKFVRQSFKRVPARRNQPAANSAQIRKNFNLRVASNCSHYPRN